MQQLLQAFKMLSEVMQQEKMLKKLEYLGLHKFALIVYSSEDLGLSSSLFTRRFLGITGQIEESIKAQK